jgi:hypothetical protein
MEEANMNQLSESQTTRESFEPEAQATFPGAWLERIAMSSSEWAKVPDNPIQRNTELHARRAKHLRLPSPMHRFVVMAVLPDGQRFKIDGHTRSFLWEKGEIARPDALAVDVVECANVNAVELLYRHFDNPGAAETAAEQLTGATRLFGLDFDTTILREGRYGAGLKRAFLLAKGYANPSSWRELPFVYAAVEFFQEELFWFDSVKPSRDRFPTGIITAYFITVRRAGEAGLEFWNLYAQDQGSKIEGSMDAVQALSEEVRTARVQKPLRLPWQERLYVAGVTAFEGFREDRKYLKGLKSMNREKLRDYAHGPKAELKSKATESRRQK